MVTVARANYCLVSVLPFVYATVVRGRLLEKHVDQLLTRSADFNSLAVSVAII